MTGRAVRAALAVATLVALGPVVLPPEPSFPSWVWLAAEVPRRLREVGVDPATGTWEAARSRRPRRPGAPAGCPPEVVADVTFRAPAGDWVLRLAPGSPPTVVPAAPAGTGTAADAERLADAVFDETWARSPARRVRGFWQVDATRRIDGWDQRAEVRSVDGHPSVVSTCTAPGAAPRPAPWRSVGLAAAGVGAVGLAAGAAAQRRGSAIRWAAVTAASAAAAGVAGVDATVAEHVAVGACAALLGPGSLGPPDRGGGVGPSVEAALGAGAAAVLAAWVVGDVFTPVPAGFLAARAVDGPARALLFAAWVAAAEELAWRGWLLDALVRRAVRPSVAVALTSLLYALPHAGTFVPPASPVWGAVSTTFAAGLVLGRARLRHGLAVAWAAHAAMDGVLFVLPDLAATPAGVGAVLAAVGLPVGAAALLARVRPADPP